MPIPKALGFLKNVYLALKVSKVCKVHKVCKVESQKSVKSVKLKVEVGFGYWDLFDIFLKKRLPHFSGLESQQHRE